MKDIVLTQEYDITLLGGDFRIDENTLQDVDNILVSAQGNFKNEPLIGANLVYLINRRVTPRVLQDIVRIQLAIDDKEYDDIKEAIHIQLKRQ
ncbi:MAG: hypothetical protein M9958_03180 [Chitinophagales bacterium]|nr:hypothetical protein [Chitinophagales bacterium]